MASKAKAGSQPDGKGSAKKRPLSAYMLFCKEKREEVKRNDPSLGTKEVVKELGRMWKSLDSAEKTRYTTQAQDNKAHFAAIQEESEEPAQKKSGKQSTKRTEDTKAKTRSKSQEDNAKRGRKKG